MSQEHEQENFYQIIYAMVHTIPEGFVATYGQIARLSGRPRHARQVGYALAALSEDHEVPWHRVVNGKGEISTRTKFPYPDYQRILLEEEGVEFNQHGRIYLKKFLWSA
jgi:methylated-DNA-protein-cysteine methyltransferase-like protein|tara:strand:- start:35 stop:361 length:327 start_codon:yes stop_codon:yes gene_type:complete